LSQELRGLAALPACWGARPFAACGRLRTAIPRDDPSRGLRGA
jgi:hypothetical protein